jgi:hypothetical protein
MTKQLRVVFLLTAIGLIATATAALADNVKIGPVKGATYSGLIKEFDKLTVKVAANGKSATVSLPSAPAYCDGDSGPEVQHAHAVKIKAGGLTAKVSYTAAGSSKPFATVTVKGNFYTFSGEQPVFQGTAKTTFSKSPQCSGQESFQADES